jgi:hypothetical protein
MLDKPTERCGLKIIEMEKEQHPIQSPGIIVFIWISKYSLWAFSDLDKHNIGYEEDFKFNYIFEISL